jgi:nitrogen fixation protein NifX
MRVAFATRDREHVDEQLRRAPHLVVYEVTAAGFSLEGSASFAPEHGHRTEARIGAMAGCSLLFVSAIGPSSVVRLASRGIRAVTAPAGKPIQDLLLELQRMLAAHHAGRVERPRP